MQKIFGIMIIAGMFSCNAKEGGSGFEVAGTVKNATADMVYLEENTPEARPTILDSATLKADGSFSLSNPTTTGDSIFYYSLQNASGFDDAFLVATGVAALSAVISLWLIPSENE